MQLTKILNVFPLLDTYAPSPPFSKWGMTILCLASPPLKRGGASPPLKKGDQGGFIALHRLFVLRLPLWKRGIKGDLKFKNMLPYRENLKTNARELRSNLTQAEARLWRRVRKKQLLGVQFYRQKPIGPYIVDFYAPAARLVVELDGSQHFEEEHQQSDQQRDSLMEQQGLLVLRFTNHQVLQQLDDVLRTLFEVVAQRVKN